MNYGLPYKGSKGKIAAEIVNRMPPATHFYDVFAGGCAVAHAAILSDKYKVVHINDIEPTPQFFVRCLNGELAGEKRIITRDEFHQLKSSDLYAALAWSFGNNAKDYLWGDDIAPLKLEACRMLLADTWQQRRQLGSKRYAAPTQVTIKRLNAPKNCFPTFRVFRVFRS